MKVAVNIEFTSDEIVKHAEDIGRRVVLNAIHDGIRHLGALKLNPDVAATAAQAVASAFAPKSPRPPEPVRSPSPPPSMERCARIESSPFSDEAWLCHNCGIVNGVHRAACRSCDHERCDVVVPPAPAPVPTDPNLS